MKIRTGFVSNSSSSSFICDITGNVESGFDISMEEMGYAGCVNGHIFLDTYLINKEYTDEEKIEKYLRYQYDETDETVESVMADETRKEEVLELFEDVWNDMIEGGYEYPEDMCPICQFEEFSQDDLIKFLYKLSGFDKEKLKKKAKTEYKDYAEFKQFLTKE